MAHQLTLLQEVSVLKLRAVSMAGILCATLATTVYGDVFILHGSFSNASRWFRPNGTFYEAVKKQAEPLGHAVHPFTWSGGVSAQSIIEAAGQFVEHILTLPPHIPVIIQAHSNGGNVAAFTTMLLGALYKSQLSDGTTLPDSVKGPFIEKKLTKNRTYVYEIAPKTEALLQSTFTRLKSTLDNSHHLRRTLPIYPIQLLCLMGTPINTEKFDVDMSVVRQVINLFSPADFIQTLVGNNLLPEHERRANVQVKLHDASLSPNPIDPCHKNIRHRLVGQWLLELPLIIGSATQNAAPYTLQSGIATFYEDKAPVFAVAALSNQSIDISLDELIEEVEDGL